MATATATKVKHRIGQSIDRRSTISDHKKVSNVSFSSKTKSFCDKPTPIDFDLFLPWICKEMEVPNSVVVLTMSKEKVPRTSGGSAKSKSSNHGKCTRTLKMKHDELNLNTKTSGTTISNGNRNSYKDNFIPITAYYNTSGHLVDIAIVGCKVQIPKEVIQAISFSFPFHSFFTRLSILKGGLHSTLLVEIGKMLPYSHLTDICLDDTFVPEGNYYVLLNGFSHLKYLSISRCSITDDICKEIFSRMKYGCPAEKSVMIVNLSSNLITDIGAKAIGDVLRENRHLEHLNLAGNRITDIGFDYILKPLTEFPLTSAEVISTKRRYSEYCKIKLDASNKCMQDISATQKSVARLSSLRQTKLKEKKKEERKKTLAMELSPRDKAEKMAFEIVGHFRDPFDIDHTFIRDNYKYSIGNFKLCSLNMSYNNLHLISLTKIIKVLSYQVAMDMKAPNTGLMRIVLEGNFLPQGCSELEIIQMYLSKAVRTQGSITVRSPILKRKSNPLERRH